MVAAAKTRVALAEKEFFPDFTVTGTVAEKGSDFEDMWSITTAVNVPIYYQTKQREAVFEAKASLAQAEHELAAAKAMLLTLVHDNRAMADNAGRLMTLYRQGLIPKTCQDFELALSGYVSGTIDELTVVSRLNAITDYELLYWKNFVERQKAIARLETAIGGPEQ
jgi:outer membrane protein TolC